MDHKNSKSEAYAAAGVDITAGYKAVELLKEDKDSCAIGIRDNKIITMPFEEVSKQVKQFNKRLYDIAHILSL